MNPNTNLKSKSNPITNANSNTYPTANAYYHLVFETDFSTANNKETLESLFHTELDRLIVKIKTNITTLDSISDVMEVYHYASLAAVLLQRKAELQAAEITKNAAPDETIHSYILSQLAYGANSNTGSNSGSSPYSNLYDDAEVVFNALPGTTNEQQNAKQLAAVMAEDFEVTGRLMRAFATTCFIGDRFTQSNSLSNPGGTLQAYEPTKLLTQNTKFPVIGVVGINPLYHQQSSLYRGNISHHVLSASAGSGFARVFADRLAELLATDSEVAEDSMSPLDRARVEEIRAYMLGKLCRGFFEMSDSHLNRVSSLVLALTGQGDCDNGATVTESRLYAIIPSECEGLLGRESIITKASVDTATGVRYRVNPGIKGFCLLVERYSLLDGRRLELLKKAADSIC